jgi:hypothetical protein
MTELTAMKSAIGLLHLPSSVRHVRCEPLPPGIDQLLRIASGDEQVAREMAEQTERPLSVIQDAAIFYIEQIMLSPDSDCYRVLGASPTTSAPDLRRNMALLISWLHPDKNLSGERAVFAARVTEAWDTLRNPDRKAVYDATLLAAHDAAPGRSSLRGERMSSRVSVVPLLHGARHRPAHWRSVDHNTIFRRVWAFLQSKARH